MAQEGKPDERDQFSTTISVRVRSESYVKHLRAICALLGMRNFNVAREALDIGVRAIVERDGRKEDAKLLKQHLEAMDKS